jgi:uncharacterized surface protein with fasciclin (FAS1) repeats
MSKINALLLAALLILLVAASVDAAQTATPTPAASEATSESTGEATAEATATPTPAPSPTPTPTVEVQKSDSNIVEIAKQTPDLSAFVAALDAAGLTDTLSDGGAFTVFAPSNAAFDALGKEAVDALMKDKAALGKVLLYHVVGGAALADDAIKAGSLFALSGDTIKVTRTDTSIMVNDASAGLKVIQASNGVIYVVDKVLTPPKPEATSEATSEATGEATSEATAAP